MGIEIPEALGGAGGAFFDAVLAIEAISMVDPAVAVLVDVHNTLVVNAIRRWATEEQRVQWLPKLAERNGGRVCTERGWFRVGRVCTADARGESGMTGYRLNGRKLWISNAKRRDVFLVFATLDPAAGYRGIMPIFCRERHAGILRWAQGRQAGNPRQQHVRTAVRWLRGSGRESAGR